MIKDKIPRQMRSHAELIAEIEGLEADLIKYEEALNKAHGKSNDLGYRVYELEAEDEKLRELLKGSLALLDNVYNDISFFDWEENELFKGVEGLRERFELIDSTKGSSRTILKQGVDSE